jgi:hypothetical protein
VVPEPNTSTSRADGSAATGTNSSAVMMALDPSKSVL